MNRYDIGMITDTDGLYVIFADHEADKIEFAKRCLDISRDAGKWLSDDDVIQQAQREQSCQINMRSND